MLAVSVFRAAGAKCNGPPGLRPQYFFTYYGAFVWDAEGRNIEAVCTRPGFWAEEWGVLGWTGILAVAAVAPPHGIERLKHGVPQSGPELKQIADLAHRVDQEESHVK